MARQYCRLHDGAVTRSLLDDGATAEAGTQPLQHQHACPLGPPPSLKLRRAKACGVRRSPKGEDGPLPRGRTENVAPFVFTYSIVKQRCALRRVNELHSGKGISAPVLLLGAGIRPTSAFFLPPRGSARHKAHDPGYPGSARECVAPGRARIAGPWACIVTPRALRRANAASLPLCR